MARSPLATVESGDVHAAQSEPDVNQTDGTESHTGGRSARSQGPKVVYIQLAAGVDKASILSVHTNTRTLVDAMEQTPGSSYTKLVLPQGEPRAKRS
jgi:hypothetical protein